MPPNVPPRLRQIYMVPDHLATAARFLETGLGLPLTFADDDRWVQFDGGAASVALAGREEAGPAPPGSTVPVFTVGDLEVAVERASRVGAIVEERRHMGTHGRIAVLTGPAGLRLALWQST